MRGLPRWQDPVQQAQELPPVSHPRYQVEVPRGAQLPPVGYLLTGVRVRCEAGRSGVPLFEGIAVACLWRGLV